jgi:uncharacterized protein (DUF433 family)
MKRQNGKNGMRLEDTVRRATGLYTVAEAATYAKIPINTLGYWLYGDRNHPALRGALIGKDEGRFLTFLEFVEALAVRTLRHTYRLPLQQICTALEIAKKEYHIEYPFADKEHKSAICGKDLLIYFKDTENPTQLTGKAKRQQSFQPCVEPFMRDLVFDDRRTAQAYIAYRYPVPNEQTTINIIMNPRYCFGDPVVEGTGYRAETLWKAAVAEGSEEKAAEYYEVKANEVIAACRYCDEIQMPA